MVPDGRRDDGYGACIERGLDVDPPVLRLEGSPAFGTPGRRRHPIAVRHGFELRTRITSRGDDLRHAHIHEPRRNQAHRVDPDAQPAHTMMTTRRPSRSDRGIALLLVLVTMATATTLAIGWLASQD